MTIFIIILINKFLKLNRILNKLRVFREIKNKHKLKN